MEALKNEQPPVIRKRSWKWVYALCALAVFGAAFVLWQFTIGVDKQAAGIDGAPMQPVMTGAMRQRYFDILDVAGKQRISNNFGGALASYEQAEALFGGSVPAKEQVRLAYLRAAVDLYQGNGKEALLKINQALVQAERLNLQNDELFAEILQTRGEALMSMNLGGARESFLAALKIYESEPQTPLIKARRQEVERALEQTKRD